MWSGASAFLTVAPLNACSKTVCTLKELEGESGPTAEILEVIQDCFTVVQAKGVVAAAAGARGT